MPLILYVGAAPDLFQFIEESRCWETAREAEREDLIAAYAPPMNADNWKSIIARALKM